MWKLVFQALSGRVYVNLLEGNICLIHVTLKYVRTSITENQKKRRWFACHHFRTPNSFISPYFLVHISRLLTVLVWAITNTPIPSHCTDLHWLVKGYPYHSRMKGHNRPRLTAECNTLKLTSQLVNQSTIMFKYINMVDGKKHIIYLVAKSHQQVYILK